MKWHGKASKTCQVKEAWDHLLYDSCKMYKEGKSIETQEVD